MFPCQFVKINCRCILSYLCPDNFTRINNGKAREFTEYISAGELTKRFQQAGYSKEYNAFYPGKHFNFSDTEIDLSLKPNAIPCTEIALPFPHNQSKLVYNAVTKTYDYYEYGKAHVDPQHNNAQLTFKNLLIQDTTFAQLDRNGYMIYNVIDVGRSGYYITNGKAIEVVWAKVGENAPTVYLRHHNRTSQRYFLPKQPLSSMIFWYFS